MDIPQIHIRQQFGKINIQTNPASVEYTSDKSLVEIKQPRGDLVIRQKPAKVQINNYPVRFDIGYKNSFDLLKDAASRAAETVMMTIARYASQGDHLMAVQNKGNALMDIISENSTPQKREIGLKVVRGPSFNVIPHEVDIRYEEHKPEINIRKNSGNYQYYRGSVDVTLAQHPEIEFSYTGNNIDLRV